MSVIVALCSSESKSTWIASDTMVASGNLTLSIGSKWIVRKPWAVGVAGHLRTINVFQHHADELLRDLPDAYEFTRRARDFLKSDGYGEGTETDGPSHFGQMLLLACPDTVWTMGADFSVTPLPVDRLWAEGSGRDLAIGAGHALGTVHDGLSDRDVVRHAIETAIAYDSICGGTPWMEELVGSASRDVR
jgi:ATP-dependent protease HslVU (ClpYQ) peptidase subunit